MPIDIIVATYGRHALLKEALQSVADQTYPEWRCWISEDGKSIETAEAIKPFLRDQRFIHLTGPHAGFPSAPRNRAIRHGRAPLIAILDDDDIWLPDKLKHQVSFLERHPKCVALGCNAFVWNGTGSWEKAPLYFKKNRMGRISYDRLLEQNYLINSSLVMRRDALLRSGPYNEHLDPPIGEDYELYMRLGAFGEIWSLPEPEMVYRQTASTYYTKLNRRSNYRVKANLYESALRGVVNMASPLSFPENTHLAQACRRERDFYRRGPRILGRFRHDITHLFQRLWIGRTVRRS